MKTKKRNSISLPASLLARGTYADRNYFSQRNKIWDRYHVKIPRVPNDTDTSTKWAETIAIPPTLKSFTGKHNLEVTTLHSLFYLPYIDYERSLSNPR